MKSKMLCPHTNTTDADGKGQALCLDCGTLVQKHLTLDFLMKHIKDIKERG